MTPQQMIQIIIGMYVFLGFGFIYTFYWLMKNDFKINITLIREGTPFTISTRGRILKDKFYRIGDMFTKKPIPNMDYQRLKDSIIMNEGFPFIGVKKVLFLKAKIKDVVCGEGIKHDEIIKYEPFIPTINNLTEIKITDTMLSWLYTSKKELFAATEPKMTREQIMRDFVLPMSLVILAVMVLIFFPKIYMSIKAASSEAMGQATGKLTDAITKFIPLG